MIGRRQFLRLGGGAALMWPQAGLTQHSTKVARIGFLATNSAANPHQIEAFRRGLLEQRWSEGSNFVIELRDARGQTERLDALANDLVAARPDVIVAGPTLATLAAMRATSTIPIVFPVAADPIGTGLIASLARPGGHVTGLSLLASELIGKSLQLLTLAAPVIRHVAVIWQPGGHSLRTDQDMLEQARAAIGGLGLRASIFEVRQPPEIDPVFDAMRDAGADSLIVLPYALFFQQRQRLVALAAAERLPAIYPWREFVDAGGLMSYGANTADLYRRAGGYVSRILRGVKPADLAVEQPTKFELVLNGETAKALGIAFPPLLREQAYEVIE